MIPGSGSEMITHSSILDWRIPWIEEPGGLQSMRLQSQTRLNDLAQAHTDIISLRNNKEQSTNKCYNTDDLQKHYAK